MKAGFLLPELQSLPVTPLSGRAGQLVMGGVEVPVGNLLEVTVLCEPVRVDRVFSWSMQGFQGEAPRTSQPHRSLSISH